MLNKELILLQTALPLEALRVPEWGGEVFVKTMTGSERDSFEAGHVAARKAGNDLANIRARLAVATLCDGEGKRLFTDEDAEALGKTHARALDRVFDVARRLNGIGKEEVAELEKNS